VSRVVIVSGLLRSEGKERQGYGKLKENVRLCVCFCKPIPPATLSNPDRKTLKSSPSSLSFAASHPIYSNTHPLIRNPRHVPNPTIHQPRARRRRRPNRRPAGSTNTLHALHRNIRLQPRVEPTDRDQRRRPFNQLPRALAVAPEIVAHRLAEGGSGRIERAGTDIAKIEADAGSRSEEELASGVAEGEEGEDEDGEGGGVGGGDGGEAVEVYDQVLGQPGAVAGVEEDAVNAGGQERREEADGQVVEDGAVRDAAFGGVQGVRGGDGPQEPEGDVGCQEVDGE